MRHRVLASGLLTLGVALAPCGALPAAQPAPAQAPVGQAPSGQPPSGQPPSGQPAPAAPKAATSWAQKLSQQALSAGFLTRLPATVSSAFGLAKAAEGSEVRQLLTKDGPGIRTFNVSVANHGDLVILNLNAQSGASVGYLLTPEGQLRKALSYQSGAAQAQPLSAADAKAGFTRETHYWSARARKLPASAAPAAPASR